MKLKLAVLSALAFVYLVCLAGPITSEPQSTFHEIGKISSGTVSIDLSSVKIDKDPSGAPIAAMIVKVRLKKPISGTFSVDNATVFSCRERSALIVASTSYDAKDVMLQSSQDERAIPWVKGSGGAVDFIMEKLCAGYKQPLPRGVREA